MTAHDGFREPGVGWAKPAVPEPARAIVGALWGAGGSGDAEIHREYAASRGRYQQTRLLTSVSKMPNLNHTVQIVPPHIDACAHLA